MTRVLSLILILFFATLAFAQTPAEPLPANVYAAGLSVAPGGSPAVAGTGLYARLVSNDTGTYAFTVVDALPASVKPFTVTTNFGIGVAQKLVTIGKVNVFVPTAAGITYAGGNTGFQWSGGVMASIKYKEHYRIMPNVRFVKSAVSNGSGYQPVFGLMFGWGQ